jgi:hypothetical protein
MSSLQMVQRLVWKEYRTLRVIWLACALAPVMLMLLLYIIHRLQNPTLPVSPIPYWGLAIWIPPIYLLAAIGTMFAGAREEGTLTWLTILSPPLHTLVGTQLAFGIVTTLLLQVILGVTAGAITNFNTRSIDMSPGDVAFLMAFLLGEAVIWGWFWSVQTSRVLQAILAAAFSVAFLNIANNVYSWNFDSGSVQTWGLTFRNVFGIGGWGRQLLYVALIPVCMKLSDRWLDGRPVDWSGAAGWWTSRGKTITVPVRKAEPVDSWRRVWQRLRWLEWQAMRPWRTAVYVATGLSCISLLFDERLMGSLVALLFWVIPFIAGLAAWQGEQHQSRFRMLAWRGASVGAVWWNKLLFWSGFAICSVLLMVIASFAGRELLAVLEHWLLPQRLNPRWSSFLAFWRLHYWEVVHEPGFAQFLNVVQSAVYWWALTFTVPFVCGHLVKRTIVALGASIVFGVIIIPWCVLVVTYRLPPLWFLAPIVAWLLWFSWRSLPAWWLERTGWRMTWREASALMLGCVFPLALLSLAAGYRVWEVPALDFTPHPPDKTGDVPTLSARLQQAPALTTSWQDVEHLIERYQPSDLMTDTNLPGDAALPDESGVARPELLIELRDRVLELPGFPPEFQLSNSAVTAARSIICPELMALAGQQLTAELRDESIRSVQAAVRLAGATLQNRIEDHFAEHPRPEVFEIFKNIQNWACHPHQNEERLVRGLRACAHELPFWQVTCEELQTQWQNERAWWKSERAAMYAYLPWENLRADRIIKLAYANRWWYLMRVRINQATPSADVASDVFLNPGQMPHWTFRPQQHDPWYSTTHGPVGLHNASQMFRAEAEFRAQLTITALVGYRHLHGELPATLNPLVEWFRGLEPEPHSITSLEASPWRTQDPSPLIDVWSGDVFGYEPTGFAVGEHFQDGSVCRQPLIWSVGPENLRAHVRDGLLARTSTHNSGVSETLSVDERLVLRGPAPGKPVIPNWIFVIPSPKDVESDKPESGTN